MSSAMSTPHHDGGARPPGPYWKRAHRDPKAWVAFVIILVAMAIFVFTDGFALLSHPGPQPIP